MGSSLFAGISGLASAGKQLDVIGNNIANVNTVGFRSGKIHFGDILSQSVTGGASAGMQVGRGVEVVGITTQFTPGSFETTGNATDLAVDGDGFFVVKDADGGEYYTRAGAFSLDNVGYLVDINGYKVQGYNLTGSYPETPLDISLAAVQSNPSPTTEISIGTNLDAATVTGGTFNASQTVYDTLGGTHSLKVTFQKTEGNGVWGAESYLSYIEADGSQDYQAASQDYCGVKFDSTGVLEKIYKGEVGTVTNTGAGAATAVVDRPGQVPHSGTLLLTRGADETKWTITDKGGYTSPAVISADASTVEICLDGTSSTKADLTLSLTGVWVAGDTLTVPLTGCEAGTGLVTPLDPNDTATAVLNNSAKFVTGNSNAITLTRGATADTWDFAVAGDDGDYTDATILSSTDTEITISLDGTTETDITLTMTGTYNPADTLDFSLVAGNGTTPTDIELTFGGIKETDAEIGSEADRGMVSWDLEGTTAEVVTGYASTSVINTLVHDGYSSGTLKSISVRQDGTISGFFTNGQTSDIARIALAKVANTSGLKRMGKNLFSATVESGSAVINRPGSAGLGDISPNSLEMSNTDIATEFINMITAQRAYQASAKIVTVTDQMMAELMNIKR